MDKGKANGDELEAMRESIRGNGERLARSRAAIGSMNDHLEETERQSKPKGRKEANR